MSRRAWWIAAPLAQLESEIDLRGEKDPDEPLVRLRRIGP